MHFDPRPGAHGRLPGDGPAQARLRRPAGRLRAPGGNAPGSAGTRHRGCGARRSRGGGPRGHAGRAVRADPLLRGIGRRHRAGAATGRAGDGRGQHQGLDLPPNGGRPAQRRLRGQPSHRGFRKTRLAGRFGRSLRERADGDRQPPGRSGSGDGARGGAVGSGRRPDLPDGTRRPRPPAGAHQPPAARRRRRAREGHRPRFRGKSRRLLRHGLLRFHPRGFRLHRHVERRPDDQRAGRGRRTAGFQNGSRAGI